MPDQVSFSAWRRAALAGLAAAALAGSLAACSKDGGAPATEPGQAGAEQAAVKPARKTGPASQPTRADRDESAAAGPEQFADAVLGGTVAGKTAAAVDLQYDVPAKPEVGRPITVALSFAPRLAADALEVEVTGMAGLVVAGDGQLRFAPVAAGQRYGGQLQVTVEAPGLYYLAVIARMVTQVQTDARTFSVPLVVGAAPAARKAAPATDGAGEPVVSLPAEETTTPRD